MKIQFNFQIVVDIDYFVFKHSLGQNKPINLLHYIGLHILFFTLHKLIVLFFTKMFKAIMSTRDLGVVRFNWNRKNLNSTQFFQSVSIHHTYVVFVVLEPL